MHSTILLSKQSLAFFILSHRAVVVAAVPWHWKLLDPIDWHRIESPWWGALLLLPPLLCYWLVAVLK
jgi:hypothetical protein